MISISENEFGGEFLVAQNYARRSVARILHRYPSEIEDVLQTAALKAWRGRAGRRGDRGATFGSWFTSIAIREALVFLRRMRGGTRKGEVSVETLGVMGKDGDVIPWEAQDEGEDAERRVIREELEVILLEEVGRLTPVRKRAVEKRLREGEVLSGSEKTAFFHARGSLRERFEERGILR